MTTCGFLELAHHHPGRLRVRSDALRQTTHDRSAKERCDRVRSFVGGMSGVRSVRLNPESGSVLVEYEPGEIDPDVLIDGAAHAAGLEVARMDESGSPRRTRPAAVAIDAARSLNRKIDEATDGRADLSDLVPLVMTGVAVYSFIVEKDRLPRWDNLAWWAYSLFKDLHATEIRQRRGRIA